MYKCSFCDRECKNANSLRNHERLCRLNPNRQQTVFQTNNPQKNNPWQSGLSKDTDERLLKISDSLKKGYLEGTIKNHQKNKSRTAEERAKISLTVLIVFLTYSAPTVCVVSQIPLHLSTPVLLADCIHVS